MLVSIISGIPVCEKSGLSHNGSMNMHLPHLAEVSFHNLYVSGITLDCGCATQDTEDSRRMFTEPEP